MLVIPERKKVVSINLQLLSQAYFCFDIPVEYQLLNKHFIKIYPVLLKDSYIFLSSYDILSIDKNMLPDVEIIQMSYLQFIVDKLLPQSPIYLSKLAEIVLTCLKLKSPSIVQDDRGKPQLIDKENSEIIITSMDFEDIRRIILYQNLLHYDDEYVNPDLKKAMDEMDELKSRQYEMPSLERKIAIITAHTGISKKEQMEMTLRSHSFLFEEVGGEVDFNTVRPAAISSGHGGDLEHWIYRKKKNRFDGYITDVDSYAKSMGNEHGAIQSIQSPNSVLGESYLQQINNFRK